MGAWCLDEWPECDWNVILFNNVVIQLPLALRQKGSEIKSASIHNWKGLVTLKLKGDSLLIFGGLSLSDSLF